MLHRMEVMNFILFYHKYFKTRVNHMITLLVFTDINKNEEKIIIQ